jgi:ketosteroid isomerase-like protein
LSRGIEAYEKTLSYFFAEADYVGVFEIDSLEINAGDEVAFATAVTHCGTPDKGGPNVEAAHQIKFERGWAASWTECWEYFCMLV